MAQHKYELEDKVEIGKDYFADDVNKAQKSKTKLVEAVIYLDSLMVCLHLGQTRAQNGWPTAYARTEGTSLNTHAT